MINGEVPKQLRQKGFSLIELMIVIAVIGILAAILIPNLLDAADRAKQRATIAELRSWAIGLGAYMTEIGTVPAEPPSQLARDIHSQLVPYAIGALHNQDKWGNNIFYYTPASLPTSYTLASGGKNGVRDICITPGTWRNYDEDLAISDGLFTCSPV